MKSEYDHSISIHQGQEIKSLFSHQSLKFIPDGRNILLFQSSFQHMPDRCPADRPINISKSRGIDISGCIQVFFDPLLCFKNNLTRYKGVDNDTCYNPYQTGKGQKDQSQLSFCQYLHTPKLAEIKTKVNSKFFLLYYFFSAKYIVK
jgi:hypothetical protein